MLTGVFATRVNAVEYGSEPPCFARTWQPSTLLEMPGRQLSKYEDNMLWLAWFEMTKVEKQLLRYVTHLRNNDFAVWYSWWPLVIARRDGCRRKCPPIKYPKSASVWCTTPHRATFGPYANGASSTGAQLPCHRKTRRHHKPALGNAAVRRGSFVSVGLVVHMLCKFICGNVD